MVKVGFIVEGACERMVIEAPNFRDFLNRHGYELLTPVIDAKGGGNLLPDHLEPFIKRLQCQGAEQIFVLTDLENETTPDMVRQRVGHDAIEFVFVAIRALEAWFLADTAAMRSFLQNDDFQDEVQPENTPGMPWDRLAEIVKEIGAKQGRGPNKVSFTRKMINRWGFSLENAANHQNCPSAKEMVDYFAQRPLKISTNS